MEENPAYSKDFPIDVVIAWVDGNDPAHIVKRKRFLSGNNTSALHTAAHPTRFASVNEIRYCILSIFTFAPFVRNVFIVTDEQDPQLWDDIKLYFPERLNSVRIVDHKEIFEGFEKFLPTFNSIAIGNMIWKIKGLSSNFVYFNDDTFLVRRMQPEDWFINRKPVIRGKWVLAPFHRMIWNRISTLYNTKVLGKKDFVPRASFHMGQWNSARLLGARFRYFTNSHTPHTVDIGLVRDFYEKNREIIERNIAHRFRHASQFTFISLSNHLLLYNGNRNIARPNLAYLQPYGRSKNYIENKIRFCENNPDIKYICVQSLEMCSKEEQQKVFIWMDRKLGLM